MAIEIPELGVRISGDAEREVYKIVHSTIEQLHHKIWMGATEEDLSNTEREAYYAVVQVVANIAAIPTAAANRDGGN